METKEKSLVRLVLDTAKPRLPAPISLTSAEQCMLSGAVEVEIRAVVDSLNSNDDRSGFELGTDTAKGIEGRINLDEKFKNNPVKRKMARNMVKGLLRDWEWFIRRSEGFALLEQSARELQKEVGIKVKE